MRDSINWARLLAFVTGLVNQQLLLQNEYLAAENRVLRAHLPTRLRLTNPREIRWRKSASASAAKRWSTLPAWLNRTPSSGGIGDLIAQKFDGSKCRAYPGRPTVGREVTELVVR